MKPLCGDFIGPWRRVFAWLPVRTFDGCWIWLRSVHRRRVQLHAYLVGPDRSGSWWFFATSPSDLHRSLNLNQNKTDDSARDSA